MTALEKSGFVLFKNTTYEDTYYTNGLFLKVKTNNSEVEITKKIEERKK